MASTLGIYMFLRNGDYYDYPWRESLQSILPIADQVVICECYSDKDNTWVELEKFAEGNSKIKLIREEWINHHSGLSKIANKCIPFLTTDWTWQIQADEVLHEKDYYNIKATIETASASDRVNALRVHYTHFMANYETEFDFCYKDIIRIARKGKNWWLVGDACQLDKPNFDRHELMDTDIMVYHYGKVHPGDVGFRKELDFQSLYSDITGYPDAKLKVMQEKLGKDYCDYIYIFDKWIKEGKVRKFEGTHPAVMRDRIEKFKNNGWEQFNSEISGRHL